MINQLYQFWQGKRKSISDDLSIASTLLQSPEQIAALIEDETNHQRFRLFQATTWARLSVATLTLIVFLIYEQSDIVPIIILGFYILLAIGLLLATQDTKEYSKRYALFIGVFDVLLLSYLIISSYDPFEVSILFFSILLSAMLLPLRQLLIILSLGIFVITLSWLQEIKHIPKLDLAHLSTWLSHLEKSLSAIEKSDINQILAVLTGLALITLITNRAADWAFRNEVTAQLRYRQLQQVLHFNYSIIEHLKSGIIVMTATAKIISTNRRAIELLNIEMPNQNMLLRNISIELARRYQHWLSSALETNQPYQHNAGAQEVSISFSSVNDKEPDKNIIMMTIESITEAQQQAQEAKLTALGRLTAGVAHEIRNPLSSIHSAAQLLEESSTHQHHKRLSSMIQSNIQRANQIIGDILGLFKETKSSKKLLPTEKTLAQFCHHFKISNKNVDFEMRLQTRLKQPTYFMFDPGQLEQVLWNLCFNALRYAKPKEKLCITVRYSLAANRRNIYIDVMDNGQGIAEENLNRIFEPFYSGGNSTGLGLYLVKELCNANNANIHYVQPSSKEPQGACFRIANQVYFTDRLKLKNLST